MGVRLLVVVRGLRSRLVLAATIAAFGAAAPSAVAYPHYWGHPTQNPNCQYFPAYLGCYDNAGMRYNPWSVVKITTIWAPAANFQFNGTCAKGVTLAGNQKGGSVCLGSGSTTALLAPTPESWAYGYWGGSGDGPFVFEMEARTP